MKNAIRRQVQRHNHSRRGVSLIEMMVVISILTVIVMLVGMTFHLLLRSEKLVTQSFVTERTISRLAIQFREDVHQSDTGVLTSMTEGAKLELALGNASEIQIRYLAINDGLVRLIVTDETVTSRDDFRLPDCHVSFVAGQEAESSLRRLVKKHQESVPLRALKIDAYLNQKSGLASKPPTETSSLENPQ
jgi:prepilin-type N-terminal cleavage/methylation domain-containing protein